jgi:hypothetical protein
MSETPNPMNAADLLVHGTFSIRRTLDRLADPMWRTVPAVARPEPPEGQHRERERPAQCIPVGRP